MTIRIGLFALWKKPARIWKSDKNMKESQIMMSKRLERAAVIFGLLLAFTAMAQAQSGSTRPRRAPQPQPTPRTNTTKSQDEPLLTPTPAKTTGAATPVAGGSTALAYSLLQQQKYAEALTEAKRVAALEPNNSEAWKIAGFAEYNLKHFAEAVTHLQRALDLQRAGGQEDNNTVDALARSFVFVEKWEQALPLLVINTERKDVPVDAVMLFYRGRAEFHLRKIAEAEHSFNEAVKANPKDAASLYYLGQIAYGRNNLDAAITALNRATAADARSAAAWVLLTSAYLRRGALATDTVKADADYLSAVRAGESLTRIRSDVETVTLFAQALIGAKQFVRAAAELEKVTTGPSVKGVTLYLLGVAQSRAKNFPKAIAALERAAVKTPDDLNVFRELGYAYEVSKQYAKALSAYEKGIKLAPTDSDFKESADRVRPFAKQ